MEEQLLKDYVATYLNPKYNRNWDVVNSKFPELSGVDKQLLKDYVATYLNPNYKGDWNVVNSKFPELFAVEQPKKKEATVSPSSAGGLVPPKSSTFTQDKEKDFSGLQVQVKDKTILNKEPRAPKIGESRTIVASESTRVPNVRIPQKEQTPDAIDETLEQIQEEKLQNLDLQYQNQQEVDFFKGDAGTFKETIGTALREFDKYSPVPLGEIIDDTARSLASGYAQGQLASAANDLMISGTIPDEKTIQSLIEYDKMIKELGPSNAFINYQKESQSVGGGFWGFIKGVSENPSVLPELIANSLTAMATNKEAVLAGTSAMLTNALATAAAAGVPTAGAGAIPGFAAGAASALPVAMGLASGIITTGATFAELLQQEVGFDSNGKPIPLTQDNVKSVLENKEKLNKIRNKAIVKGISVGAIDLATAKTASAVGAKILTKSAANSVTGAPTRGAYTKSVATGSAIESGGGALGEVVGTELAGEKQSLENALFEAVTELPMGALSTVSARLSPSVYKVNKKKVTAEQLDEIIDTMNPEDLAKADIEIKNDFAGRENRMQDKILTGSIAKQVREAQPDLNEQTVNAIVELQKELNKLEGNKTQVAKDRAAKIRADIKNLQDNQLPETSKDTTATSTTEDLAQPIADQEKVEGKEAVKAEVSYTIDGAKMDRGRFVAAVQEANTEDALNDLETTDPEVQKIINAKRAEITGEIQPVTINVADKYTSDEVERVKTLPIENEDGATMNLDGTKYEKGGVVIPLASRNLPISELTPEKINEFVKENSESIGSDLVKVGIYKFPGRAEASIDINIVADRSRREEALQIARELGQESIFDLDTFENIKTGADGKNPKVLTPKEFLEIQERLSRKPEATVTPETSSNYANMTEDNEGNFVFFHVGDKGYETIKPGTGMAPVTSREEAAALGKVGGMAMYYTGPEQGERQTAQGAKYAVKVPKNKVYDFNTDPLNLIDEAKKRHEEENPGKAFDPNSQIAYVTKIAGEKGFDMVVADWAGGTRAQTTKELTPVDVEESTGNVVEKKFSEQFKSNKEKGFKAVVPARKADKLQKVYEKINEERNSQKRYDDLYRLYTETDNYTQQEITDLINESDLSQELKDEYNSVLESKEEARRSERTTEVETAKQKKEDLPENVEEAIRNSAKTLQTSFPGVKIIVSENITTLRNKVVRQLTSVIGLNNAKSVADSLKTSRGQALFYNGKPVAVIINKEKAISTTAAHEVWHLILREAFGRDAKKFKSFQNAISRELKNSGYTDVAEYLDRFAAAYEGDAAYEEYLAELGGLLTTKGFDPKNLTAQEKSVLDKIKDIINKFAKSIIGQDVFLKDATPENILEFMINVSDLVAKGEDVRTAIGKGETTEGEGMESSLQNDFSDPVSKLTFIYDKNSKRFEQLKKDGFINEDVDINDFNGKIIMLHRPDAAFSGEIQKNGETLVEGQGGMYYPIKFHDMNVFWASTESAVSSMVNSLRDVAFENGGKVYMALVSSPYDKLLSSTTMSNAVMDFFSSKAIDKNFNIKPAQLKNALISASKFTKEIKKTEEDGTISIKKVGLKLKFSERDSIKSIKDKIAEKLSPTNSSFNDRKAFVEQLIKEMTANINQSDVSIQQFGELFSKGIQNKYFKGITKTGKVSISAANMTQALSEMFTEPVLKEGFDNRKTGGQVYAILEVDSPTITNPDDVNRIKELKKERSKYDRNKSDAAKRKVSAINAKIYAILDKNSGISPADSDFHKSYPKTVKSENPVKIHILKDRPYWYDVFGGGIKKESRDSIFPTTSGVTTGGIQLSIPGVEISKQITTDKDVKPGFEAALNAINETVEDRSVWRKQNKVNQKQKRNPIVEQAAKDYYNGLITQEDYLDTVKKNQPIKTFKSVPELPSVREIVNSLDENKVATGIIGVTKNIKDGDKVASRLDIPAYEDFDTWVVSIHDGDKEGKSIAYGQTAVLKNVNFKTFPGPAIKIAMGTQSKSTIARIFGNWVNENPEEVQERAKKLMNDPEWTQVGMNPFRHSYFYDKTDGMPVATADEVIQVGALVLAKNAKKVLPSDPMFTTKSAQGLEIQFQKQLPARVNDQINNIISEQKALGNKPVDVAREAAKYLKSTDAYKKLGDRDKAKVLSGVKRLSGMRVKVTVDEYAALKDQIKLEAKSAKNYETAIKSLVASVRSLVKTGKISSFRAGVIIGRISKTNLASPESVNKTIDYIADIFDSANLAMKISRAKSLVKNAKRNIKSKIGQNQELFTGAKVLLSIDPHLIPTPFIDDYLNIMEVIGERAKTLSIKDTGEMAVKMNVIINAVISESENSVTSGEQTKTKMTPEESTKQAEAIIKQIENEKLDTSKVLDKNANAVARKIASINRKDMTNLLSTDKDGVVDYSKLKLLLGIRDNIKAGIVTNDALNLATTVEQNRGVDTFSKVLPKIDGMSILNGVTRTLGEVKSLITNKTGVLESVRGTGTFNVDDIVGNFNDNTIYKLTFGKLASAKGALDATLSDRAAKASAAEILFNKGVRVGINIGPVKFTSRTNNDVVKAKYKVQALLLQKEFESNPGNESVSPAIDFINATIKAIERKKSSLTKHDAKILRQIKTEFGSKDANGNETLNFKNMEESLTENDKKAMKLIEEINASTAEEALFTSSVIRGNRVDILNNYVHHAVSDRNLMEQMVDLVNKLLEIGPKGKPSTKAGTLNERTPGAKAIIFDPVFSSMKGARETLTDFYMTPVIREVSGMLEKLENKVLDDNSTTEAQRDSVQAVKEAVKEALQITFQNHFSEDSFGEALIKGIQKLGYQSMLASLPRAGAELVSNMSYGVLSDPVKMAKSVQFADFAYSSDMLPFLENIKSSESTRLAGNEMLTSKYAEGGFAAGYGRTSKSGASSKVVNYASFIGDMTVGNIFRTNDVTSDLIVSTPDKAVSKPYYAQFFVDKFKELTGVELSNSDLKKISEGTSEYLSPEYEDAIQKSREDADLAVIRMSGSVNAFNTILKNVPRKTDKPWTAAYRAINSLMARFYLTEYGTTRSAIIALFKTGQISRQTAIGLLAGSLTRMSMYLVAFGVLAKLFDSAISSLLDLEEPEEEEEDLMDTAKRSMVGSGVNLLTRRTLGNVPYIPIALGVELLNEELGEDYGLRDGDYDPYKNSLVFSKITSNDFYTKSPYEIFGKVVAGPFSPMVSTGFRAITLGTRAVKEGSKPETKKRAMDELTQRMSMEAVGNFGLIPFYKDARRIMINDFYARNYDKKEDSSFTITKKQIDLVRKSNPRAAERLEAVRKSEKKKGEKERAYERTKSN